MSEYVLGTQDDEIERLAMQHGLWRPRMLEAFRRAGIGPGATVIDVGAGPGFAAFDLAEIVGADGRVIALERSRRFLGALNERARRLGIVNVEAREQDVAEEGFGVSVADHAWCRWVLCFVDRARRAVGHIATALRPGGVAVFHEYANYSCWRTMPPDPDVDRFRDLVTQSWRDAGGEPDVALELPAWLAAEGLEVLQVRPLIEIAPRRNATWLTAFMATGANRLRELGYIDADEARRLSRALERLAPDTPVITPLVAEIIARKTARR